MLNERMVTRRRRRSCRLMARAASRGRRGSAGAALVSWLALSGAGCDAAGGSAGGPQVRDSAGVSLITLSEPEWSGDERWRVREELVIGGVGTGPEPAFGYVADLDVDGEGRIYALDQQARTVYVFGPDGREIGRLGGPGDGPGELGSLVASVVVRGDTVLVGDWSQDRLTRFSLDGDLLSTRAIPGEGAARTWWTSSGGDVYLRSLRMYTDEEDRWNGRDALLRHRGDDAVDTVMAFAYETSDLGGPGSPNVPLILNAPAWTVLDDGRVAWVPLLEGGLRIHGPDGTLGSIVTSDRWRRRSPGAAEIRLLEEKLGDRLELLGGSREILDQLPVEAPEALPAITAVEAGPDGTLWVQRMGPIEAVHPMALNTPDPPVGLGGTTWDVLTPDGRYLGTIELPPRFRIMRITDDAVYGVARDELDVDRVVRLRLER